MDYEEARKQVQDIAKNTSNNYAPPNGTYLFEVISSKLASNVAKEDFDGDGEGCPQLQVRIAPVGENGRPILKYATMEWVTLPIQNAAIVDHKVSDGTLRKFTFRFANLIDTSIVWPSARKDDDGKYVPYTADELMQMEDAKVKALVLAYKLKEAPGSLKGERYFATTKESDKPDRKGFYNLSHRRIALADGETVSTLTK